MLTLRRFVSIIRTSNPLDVQEVLNIPLTSAMVLNLLRMRILMWVWFFQCSNFEFVISHALFHGQNVIGLTLFVVLYRVLSLFLIGRNVIGVLEEDSSLVHFTCRRYI